MKEDSSSTSPQLTPQDSILNPTVCLEQLSTLPSVFAKWRPEDRAAVIKQMSDIILQLQQISKSRDGTWPVGLENIGGTTCWFNPVIQSLFHIPEFRELILYYSSCCKDKAIKEYMSELRRLFALMLFSKYESVNPKSTIEPFKKQLRISAGHQDSSKFLQDLITLLENAFNRIDVGSLRDNDPGAASADGTDSNGVCKTPIARDCDTEENKEQKRIEKLFYGKVISYSKNVGTQTDLMCLLPLSAYGCHNVHESLKSYLNTEQQWFSELPLVLTLELSRVRFNEATEESQKLQHQFTFPETLYLDRYLYNNKEKVQQCRESVSGVKGDSDSMLKAGIDSSPDLLKHPYKLHAVLVHEGEADLGHYWAYIYNPQLTVWLKYNDRVVTKSSWEEVKRESYGGDNEKPSAYCLMYISGAELANSEPGISTVCSTSANLEQAYNLLPEDLKSYVKLQLEQEERENETMRQHGLATKPHRKTVDSLMKPKDSRAHQMAFSGGKSDLDMLHQSAKPLLCVTWNVAGATKLFAKDRVLRAMAKIKEKDPAVVLLQEFPQSLLDDLKKEFHGYKCELTHVQKTRLCLVTLLKNDCFDRIEDNNLIKLTQHVLGIKVIDHSGSCWHIFNCHLKATVKERKKKEGEAFKRIFEKVDHNIEVIIGGDMSILKDEKNYNLTQSHIKDAWDSSSHATQQEYPYTVLRSENALSQLKVAWAIEKTEPNAERFDRIYYKSHRYSFGKYEHFGKENKPTADLTATANIPCSDHCGVAVQLIMESPSSSSAEGPAHAFQLPHDKLEEDILLDRQKLEEGLSLSHLTNPQEHTEEADMPSETKDQNCGHNMRSN